MDSAIKIKIIGDVQGVFFRHHAEKEAKKLELSGWVQNEHDGSVTIFAQGSKKNVNKLVEWSREGSPMARVDRVEAQASEIDLSLRGFQGR